MECLQTLQGHTGSVLCLQYDERVVVTGSSDSTIRSVGTHMCTCVHTFSKCSCYYIPNPHNNEALVAQHTRCMSVGFVRIVAEVSLGILL